VPASSVASDENPRLPAAPTVPSRPSRETRRTLPEPEARKRGLSGCS